ncbi:MAG: cellulase family glycosylhydrolase [Clostridia bacterium]|nr:cellulase family glycosylhydrolase [Clostridia bacterium]
MKTSKKLISALLALVLLLSCGAVAFAEDGADFSPAPITAKDALHTEGEKMFNADGEEVFLRGVNLGGWLIQEDWFCPTDNGTQGDHWTLETLISRFGVERAYELYNIYWDNWITEYDFAEIAKMGFNSVRIPFWYRNFQSDDNGTWILNDAGEIDFSRLDRAVELCRQYGLYAILDLHGVNGCQGAQDHCGQKNNCRFFDKTEQGEKYRAEAVELWTLIAERFAGDPAVAMFDLLNEPLCDIPRFKRNYDLVNGFYDDAYKAIRGKDPTRVVCMMGTWDIGKLPNPKKMGWTDVVYQLHQYNDTQASFESRIDASRALKYNVPLYAGEFHPTGVGDAEPNVTVSEILQTYENEGVNWTVWTWKGYNSWAAWADWFIWGSVEDSLTVDPENDSYETIAEKWGAMRTDGGNFYSGHLDEEVVPFLPDGREDDKQISDFAAFFINLYRKLRIVFEVLVNLFT